MVSALERLHLVIHSLPDILSGISEAESEHRPSPERWSMKEVLGHLIDSASNNHQRFVRAQIVGRLEFPGYEQEAWVRVQKYQEAAWADLIALWRALNLHVVHIVAHMSEQDRATVCRVGSKDDETLTALFEDYVSHLEHHLRKILGEWPPHE
jgi:hypothetical protein